VTSGDDRFRVLSDAQWALIEGLLPQSEDVRGPNFKNNRLVVEGILYRLRTGAPWRDLPERFGPWQTVWKRQRRYAGDGTWDRILVALAALADDNSALDWAVSVDSTVVRAHQHAGGARRIDAGDTGGTIELHESVR
jgi:transposase